MPKFEREVEIDAPVEKVWQVMTDPKYVDQWFPGVDNVTSNTTTMPAWYTRYRANHNLTNGTPPARSTTRASTSCRPASSG